MNRSGRLEQFLPQNQFSGGRKRWCRQIRCKKTLREICGWAVSRLETALHHETVCESNRVEAEQTNGAQHSSRLPTLFSGMAKCSYSGIPKQGALSKVIDKPHSGLFGDSENSGSTYETLFSGKPRPSQLTRQADLPVLKKTSH